MKRLLGLAILSTSFIILAADFGLPVGSPMPHFQAENQNGTVRSLKDILGPNGAVIVFFRSADW